MAARHRVTHAAALYSTALLICSLCLEGNTLPPLERFPGGKEVGLSVPRGAL